MARMLILDEKKIRKGRPVGLPYQGSKKEPEYNQVRNQLEQFQRLQQLERLQQFEVTNKDYRDFSDVKGAVFYLDPPYENSYVGGYSDSKQFNHAEFYSWAAEMARENIVLLSSYTVSDDRFEEVFRFGTAQSTLSGGIDKTRCEKLFMVKGGLYESHGS